MATLLSATGELRTLADLIKQLGDIPPERIRLRPPPGTATEQDVIDLEARENRLCELVDGVLVEKAMGFRESLLAGVLIQHLRNYVSQQQLGVVAAPDGMMRLAPGLVRLPDVAFVSWDRFPGRRVPADPIPDLAPDLAVEVLSKSNTEAEMARKLREYFGVGVREVWLVDPDARSVEVYTALDRSTDLSQSETLTSSELLPGFALPLRQLFAELDR